MRRGRPIAGPAIALLALLAGLALAPAPAAARRLDVTIALRSRDPHGLAVYARAVSTPGSPHYGDYLTPRQFAARFGAGGARIAALRDALRARGLAPGRASAGGLSVPFSVNLGGSTRARRRALDEARALTTSLPRAARAAVQTLVGLDRPLGARPLALRARHRVPAGFGVRAPRVTTPAPGGATGPQPCAAASAGATAAGAYTANETAAAYGFAPLYAQGDEGAGTTVAVYELEPDDPADIAAFQRCYDTDAEISYVHVDGGAGVGAGSDEAAFDIENLIAFAPAARLLVYQGPNSSSGLPGSGPYDVFSAIVNQDRARVVSVSWGQCEAALGARAQSAEATLFEQAAIEGQTLVAAAGDNGAEDCDTGGASSSTAPAVDDPASQPEVVGVGGTTLQQIGPPPVETVWNGGTAHGSGAGVGAGGGGVSDRWPMPADQVDTPGWLHVRSAAVAAGSCGPRDGECRAVPDVAADADPSTGYEIYWNGADTVPAPSGWQALGGTSGAAPLWAALFALADASPACAGSPLGFAGPALYAAAAGDYLGDFHDVRSGDNDFTGTAGGRWAAGRGFDLASGLGSPDAAPLVARLCANTIHVSAIAGQSSARGAAVALALHGSPSRGGPLSYSAEHLPAGLHLDPRSGRVSGRPTRAGRQTVRAIATSRRGAQASVQFSWFVGTPPRIAARLSGTGAAMALTLTVRSATHGPWLRSVRIHLPAGLRARGAPSAGARGARTIRVTGAVVSVALASPGPSLALRIPVAGRTARGAAVSAGVRSGTTGTSVTRTEPAR